MLPSSTPGAARRGSCEWCGGWESRVWGAPEGPPSVHALARISCQRELARGSSLAGSAHRNLIPAVCPPHCPCRLFNMTGPLFGLDQLPSVAVTSSAGWTTPLEVKRACTPHPQHLVAGAGPAAAE